MRSLLILALAAALPTLAPAAEEPTTAQKLLDVMRFEQTAIEVAGSAFGPMLEQMKAQGMPPEAITEIEAAARKLMVRAFVDGKVKDQVAELYSQRFTEAELLDLIAFYETPLGRKMLDEQAALSQESMMLGVRAVEKHQADFQQEVMSIIEKYQAVPAE